MQWSVMTSGIKLRAQARGTRHTQDDECCQNRAAAVLLQLTMTTLGFLRRTYLFWLMVSVLGQLDPLLLGDLGAPLKCNSDVAKHSDLSRPAGILDFYVKYNLSSKLFLNV